VKPDQNKKPSTQDGRPPAKKELEPRLIVMIVVALACLLPWITPQIALALGIVLALLGLTARTKEATKIAKILIQVAVVMLGLGMDLRQVAAAGLVGIVFAAGTIIGTFALGIILGRTLGTEAKLTTLLSSGTAICGGSAIAATASVIAATEAQIAVAMGAVFLLNSLAVYIFPPLGHAMGMSAHQFGTWAAIAIHDVSSVVTAAGAYDRSWPDAQNAALASQTATAVKLTRTLWIAPVALACAWWFRRSDARAGTKKAKIPIPWFVLWFVIAAAIGTEFHKGVAPIAVPAAALAKDKLMAVALMLIGCGLSPKAVVRVGWRAMVLAVGLWIAISAAAMWAVVHSIA
jgi:uncharacterized integral membrane protein (TIGR00698 family)